MFNAKKTTTVDGILAAFTKTISELRQCAEANLAEASSKQEQADELYEQSRAHANEADRADSVANKLQTVINS